MRVEGVCTRGPMNAARAGRPEPGRLKMKRTMKSHNGKAIDLIAWWHKENGIEIANPDTIDRAVEECVPLRVEYRRFYSVLPPKRIWPHSQLLREVQRVIDGRRKPNRTTKKTKRRKSQGKNTSGVTFSVEL